MMSDRKISNRSMKKIVPIAASTFAALMLIAAFAGIPAANAVVKYDFDTGEGTVGKSDVQKAFGYNNPQFQANAPYKFTERVSDSESDSSSRSTWVCVMSIEYETKTSKGKEPQITSFILQGYTIKVSDKDPENTAERSTCSQVPSTEELIVEELIVTNKNGESRTLLTN